MVSAFVNKAQVCMYVLLLFLLKLNYACDIISESKMGTIVSKTMYTFFTYFLFSCCQRQTTLLQGSIKYIVVKCFMFGYWV